MLYKAVSLSEDVINIMDRERKNGESYNSYLNRVLGNVEDPLIKEIKDLKHLIMNQVLNNIPITKQPSTATRTIKKETKTDNTNKDNKRPSCPVCERLMVKQRTNKDGRINYICKAKNHKDNKQYSVTV